MKYMEERYNRRITGTPLPPVHKIDPFTVDNIIKKGDLNQKIILHFKDNEGNPVTGADHLLTDEQREELDKALKAPEAVKPLSKATILYWLSVKYARHLLSLRRAYQAKAEALATICTKWEGYDNQAKTIDKFIDGFFISPKTKEEGKKFADPRHSKKELEKALDSFFNISVEDKEGEATPIREGVVFRARQEGTDPEGKPIYRTYADIFGKDGLYKKIKEKRKEAEEALQQYKAGIEQFIDFITTERTFVPGTSVNPYVFLIRPSVVAVLKNPDYTDFMNEANSGKYFEFRLKQKQERGEPITEADIKRAVFPDYNQVKPTKKQMLSQKQWIKNYFNDFLIREHL